MYSETAKKLKELISGKPGDTIPVRLPNWSEFDPCNNDGLHATVVNHPTGTAVLVHWGLTGDWTKALLIPSNLFEGDDLFDVEEALEWLDSDL